MITEIRGGFNVKRFHTTHRTQEETVGHHSAGVCAILLRLDPNCSRDLLVAALMHDVPEVYTGDVPAPFKWDSEQAKTALTYGEGMYIIDNDIPDPELTPDEEWMLKLADMVDLVLSSIEEVRRGNEYAKALIANGQAYIESMHLDSELMDKVEKMVGEVKHGSK